MKAGNVPRTAIRLAIRAYNGNWKASVGSLENLDIANELSLRLWSEKVTGDTGCALLRFDRGPRIPRVAAIIGESFGDCFWLPPWSLWYLSRSRVAPTPACPRNIREFQHRPHMVFECELWRCLKFSKKRSYAQAGPCHSRNYL